MYSIKWVNKYSREEGYVAKVMKQKGFFMNTYNISEAKKYRSESSANTEIDFLNSIGEGENNEFYVIKTEDTPKTKEDTKTTQNKTKKTSAASKNKSKITDNACYCPICQGKTQVNAKIYFCQNCYTSFKRATISDMIKKIGSISRVETERKLSA